MFKHAVLRPFHYSPKSTANLSTVQPSRDHNVFDGLPRRNLFALTSLLTSHLQNNDPLTAWFLFQRIHRARTDLNSYIFTPILGVCSAFPRPLLGRQVHALMIRYGFHSELVLQTGLMNLYSKQTLMVDATKVFDEMAFKDVVTWNTLISNYLRHGMPMEAIAAFYEMRKAGAGFSHFTLCSLLKACSSLDGLRQGVQVHGLIVTMGTDLVILATALIDFYSQFGMIDKAIHVYESIRHGKDSVMYNSFIAACVRNRRYSVALSIMNDVKPNAVALTTALSACSENSDLQVGKQIHCVAVRFGLIDDTQLQNVLLDMYAKSGKISLARTIFDKMPRGNVVSWTSMIDAYGSNGDGNLAVELFQKMEGEERNGIIPNEVTFLSVLSACLHSGMVVQGREYFQLMQEKYGLVPGPDHYACYIDILGRAGHIKEVWCVYEDMVKGGFEPTSAVWAALINACSQSNDVSGGEFAAKRLFLLEPDKPRTYVLTSNFYASLGKWDVVDKMRSIMKEKGLSKTVGTSWVTASCKEQNYVNLPS